MEELKLLVEMVKDLPSMALWVIAFFFVYKVSIIGSVYGVIRLAIVKWHSWKTTPKHELITQDVRMMLDGEVITGAREALVNQILRLRNRGRDTGSSFVHSHDVDWLRKAIDEKIARDAAEKAK